MADDRLRTKLVAAGYDEELVWSWERDEMMARYAEVLVEGAKAKPVPAPVTVDKALLRESDWHLNRKNGRPTKKIRNCNERQNKKMGG